MKLKSYLKGGAFAAAAFVLNLSAAADVSAPDIDEVVEATPTALVEAQLAALDDAAPLPEMSMIERNFRQYQMDSLQSYSLSANLLHENFCKDVAREMCEFMLTAPPGIQAMYQACFEYHRDTCLDELRSPGEEIGGQ